MPVSAPVATVTVMLPDSKPEVAVSTALPALTAVALPPAPNDITPGLLDVHVALEVRSGVLPSETVPVAFS